MNEKRKLHSDFLNNKLITPEQEKAEELVSVIYMLIRDLVLHSEDKKVLEIMIRQLEDPKQKPTKKVLRGMTAKIERIKQNAHQKYR